LEAKKIAIDLKGIYKNFCDMVMQLDS